MRITLALALLAVGCRTATVAYHEQEVTVRYDAARDELHLGFVYHWVQADPEHPAVGPIEEDVERVEALGAGRRYFVFCGWPHEYDLEQGRVQGVALDPEDPFWVGGEGGLQIDLPDEIRMALVAPLEALGEFAEGVLVEDAGFFLLDDGRLGVWQRALVPEASRLQRLHADFWNAALLAAAAFHDVDLSDEVDPMVRHARRGDLWFDLKEAALEVHRPADPAALARLLAGFAKDASEPEPGWSAYWIPVLEALSEVEVVGERLVLRWRPDEDGWYRFRFRREDWTYAPATLERLRSRGWTIERLGVEQARRRARGQGL